MKRIKHLLFIIPIVLFLLVCANIKADEHGITFKEGDGELTSAVADYDWQGIHYIDNVKQIHLRINVKPGKRLIGLSYGLSSDDPEEYTQVPLEELHSYANIHVKEVNLDLPIDDSTILFTFEDYEPATISYAKYLGDDYNESATMDQTSYEQNWTTILTNYKGGDVILPTGCTDNGCMLQIEYDSASCDAIQARLDNHNNGANEWDQWKWFGDSSDHIDRPYAMAQPLQYAGFVSGDYGCKVTAIVNKYFTDFGIQAFTIADNQNEIMSSDFIGATVESSTGKFDDSIAEDGYMYFTEHNNYTKESSIFYGVNELYTTFYSPRPLNADIETNNMGTLIYEPDRVEVDNDDYEVTWDDEANKATVKINSYYEQEYKLDLKLVKHDEVLKTIHLILNRFAFAGNAGQLSLVDENNNPCPSNNNENCYYSTQYRGEPDVFYTTGETRPLNYFEWSIQSNGLNAGAVPTETVYEANKDFHPWAIAMYYNSDDEIVKTKSFDLNEIKIGGITNDISIPEDEINGLAWNNEIQGYVTGYNSSNFEYFHHGLGKEIAIRYIDYYTRNSYENVRIFETLKLIKKTEAQELGVTKISLFLANGQLTDGDEAFPELTYGVGQGKIFEIDERMAG